jgi:hypothetical protein
MADITTMQDLLKLQQEANDFLAKRLGPMRTGKLPPTDDLLAAQATDIARVKAALEHAIKQRDTVVKNWDDRIGRLSARVDKLSKEREEVEGLLQHTKKDDGTKKATPTKRPSKK